MSSIFVIVYPQQQFNVTGTLRLNGWDTSQSGPAPQQGQPDPHFIGRFRASPFARVAYAPAGDVAAVTVEANPHFVGRFAASRFASARNSWDTGATTASGPIEANPHQIGRFQPAVLARPVNSWDTSAAGTPPQLGQPDPHFIGRAWTVQFRQPIQSAAADVGATPEANPHFTGRFTVSHLARPLNSWDASLSGPAPQQGQPDPHYVGRFGTARLARIALSWAPSEVPAASAPEANPHWVARRTGSPWWFLRAWSAGLDIGVVPPAPVPPPPAPTPQRTSVAGSVNRATAAPFVDRAAVSPRVSRSTTAGEP